MERLNSHGADFYFNFSLHRHFYYTLMVVSVKFYSLKFGLVSIPYPSSLNIFFAISGLRFIAILTSQQAKHSSPDRIISFPHHRHFSVSGLQISFISAEHSLQSHLGIGCLHQTTIFQRHRDRLVSPAGDY